jgi:ubiquinone/menaquinone biosynthesis C-methylase UbiE
MSFGFHVEIRKTVVNRSSDRRSKNILSTVQSHFTIPDSGKVLEIGAGRGALSYLVYQQYKTGRMVVTDYDPSQVEAAKAHFGTKLGTAASGVEFRTADALNLPFEDESFDAVFAINMLHHVGQGSGLTEAEAKAIGEIRRVLKHRGFFIYRELFHKDTVRNLLKKAGFMQVFAKRYLFLRDLAVYQKPD